LLNNNELVSIVDSVVIISGIAFVAAIDRRRLSYGDPFRRLPAIGFAKPGSRFGYTKTWFDEARGWQGGGVVGGD